MRNIVKLITWQEKVLRSSYGFLARPFLCAKPQNFSPCISFTAPLFKPWIVAPLAHRCARATLQFTARLQPVSAFSRNRLLSILDVWISGLKNLFSSGLSKSVWWNELCWRSLVYYSVLSNLYKIIFLLSTYQPSGVSPRHPQWDKLLP